MTKKIMRQDWGSLVYPSRMLRLSLSPSGGDVRFVVESRTRSLIPHLTACPKQMGDSGNWHQRPRQAAVALSPEMQHLHPSSHSVCQAPDNVEVTKEDFCKSTHSWGQCAPVLKYKSTYLILFCTIILLNVIPPAAVSCIFFQDFTEEKEKLCLIINSWLEKKLLNFPWLLSIIHSCLVWPPFVSSSSLIRTSTHEAQSIKASPHKLNCFSAFRSN